MADAVAAARAAFPDLDVPTETFAAYVTERLSDDVPALDQLAQPSITDLYLACACRSNVPGAIAAFENRMTPVLRQVHATTRLPFDELVQMLRVHLFVGDAIASYRGRGRLASWLRVTAIRLVRRQEPARQTEVAVTRDELVRIADRAADPELAAFRARHRHLLGEALEQALAALEPRERRFLRYRYVNGMEVAAIADAYGIHRVTASRLFARTIERLSDGVRAGLREKLSLPDDEIDGVIEGLWSELEIRLSQMLRTTPDRSG